MVLTKQQKATILTYLITEVFDQAADSDLAKALAHSGLTDPHSIVAMVDHEFEDLKYPVESKHSLIKKGDANLLKCFKKYVLYKQAIGMPIQDHDWTSISKEEFDDYRIGGYHDPLPPIAPPLPPTQSTFKIDIVREFRKGIRCDASSFTPYKDDAFWDSWN